ncbi:hypothetical protein [Cupriavidus sp. 8B]
MGFTENPFAPQALRPDAQGKRLLVGRDAEVELVAQRLHKKGKITCLDGHVGVGKTSLVNVAAYECFNAYLKGETPQLLIPSVVSYQLKPNVEQFCTEVFQGIAQTLIHYYDQLRGVYDTKGLPQLDAWLNSPIVEHINVAGGAGVRIGVPGVSFSANAGAGQAKQVNQSVGFAQSGFDTLVKSCLSQIFATQGLGGVVCVIDNIELLETGENARKALEALRDRLFQVDGIRWVFCGANGVIHSLAGSPRLNAFLNTPVLNVANVKPASIIPLVNARLDEYSTDVKKAEEELPVDLNDLELLYRIVNSNLRDFLGLADEYCESVQSGKPLRTTTTKKERFNRWLEKATKERYEALSNRLPPNAWVILDVAMSNVFQGIFGAGDYNSFNQNSTVNFAESTFAKWLRSLVKLGLVSKEKDLEDSRSDKSSANDEDDGEPGAFSRDVYTVTAKGALVHYARRKQRENLSIAEDPEWMRPIHHVEGRSGRR